MLHLWILTLVFNLQFILLSPSLSPLSDLSLYRVEGRGKAVITDVIYSSETSSEEEKPSSESKEKYEALKVCVCEHDIEYDIVWLCACVVDRGIDMMGSFVTEVVHGSEHNLFMVVNATSSLWHWK